MCIGGSPKAPINKPAYAPEDAHKHFKYGEDSGKASDTKTRVEDEPTASPATGPKIKASHDSIRM